MKTMDLMVRSRLLVAFAMLAFLAACGGDGSSSGADGSSDGPSFGSGDSGETGGTEITESTTDESTTVGDGDGTTVGDGDETTIGHGDSTTTDEGEATDGGSDAVETDSGETTDEPTTDSGSSDPCADVDCSALDGACTVGTCDATTGECESMPANEGEACDDGDLCTVSVCEDGVCAGPDLDCSALDGECTVGTCDATTGECVSTSANEGESCDDGDLCTMSVCEDGVCAGPVRDCSALDGECAAGECDGETGDCRAAAIREDEACDEENLCTEGRCVEGECLVVSEEVCNRGVGCTPSLCDPSTGTCVTETLDEGAPCVLAPDFCDGEFFPTCSGSGLCYSQLNSDCGYWGEPSRTNVPLSAYMGLTSEAPSTLVCGPGRMLTAVRASNSTRAGYRQYFTEWRFLCTEFGVQHGVDGWVVTQGASGATVALGTDSAQDTVHWSRCPDGHAAIGFEGAMGTYINGFRLLCAPVVVREEGGLEMGPGEPVVPADWLGAEPEELEGPYACGDAAFAIGARVRHGWVVDGLAMHCARFPMPHLRTGEVVGLREGDASNAWCSGETVPIGLRALVQESGELAGVRLDCAGLDIEAGTEGPTVTIRSSGVSMSQVLGTAATGTAVDAQCPPGEAIHSFSPVLGGSERPVGIRAECGSPTLTGSDANGYGLQIERDGGSAQIGSTGEGSELTCRPGYVLFGLWGQTGELLNAVAPRCRPAWIIRP